MRKLMWVLPVVPLMVSCATGATSGRGTSLFPGDDDHEAQARKVVVERAKFDLDCAELQLVKLGDVTRLGQQMTSMSLGATGCGKKASYYIECVSNWGNITCNPRMNSSSTTAAQD